MNTPFAPPPVPWKERNALGELPDRVYFPNTDLDGSHPRYKLDSEELARGVSVTIEAENGFAVYRLDTTDPVCSGWIAVLVQDALRRNSGGLAGGSTSAPLKS